jgi:hypothetical protein
MPRPPSHRGPTARPFRVIDSLQPDL